MVAGDACAKTDLHTEDHVPVLLDGADGELGIGIAKVEQLAVRVASGKSRLPDDRDVQERINAGVHNVDDVFAETRKRVGASGPCIYDGGDTLGNAIRICRNAKRRDAVIYVHVDVDEPGRDDFAPCIEDLAGLVSGIPAPTRAIL